MKLIYRYILWNLIKSINLFQSQQLLTQLDLSFNLIKEISDDSFKILKKELVG